MTDTEHQINQWFASHMEHTAQAASTAGPAIEEVANAFVETLLQDGKIVTCANGNANILAQYFCTALLNRFEQDRPALPAINLGADATTYSAICRDNRFNDTFSRQVRAIGKPGDLLFVIVVVIRYWLFDVRYRSWLLVIRHSLSLLLSLFVIVIRCC